jgi:hypothetical protein
MNCLREFTRTAEKLRFLALSLRSAAGDPQRYPDA